MLRLGSKWLCLTIPLQAQISQEDEINSCDNPIFYKPKDSFLAITQFQRLEYHVWHNQEFFVVLSVCQVVVEFWQVGPFWTHH